MMTLKQPNLQNLEQNYFKDFALYGLLVALIVLAFVAPSTFNTLYPAIIVPLAFYLAFRNYDNYLQVVLWVWLLNPFFRRVVDLQLGFESKSYLSVVPLLVSIGSLFKLLSLRKAQHARVLNPLILMSCSIFYAFLLGNINFGMGPAFYDLLQWVAPFLIAVASYSHDDFESLDQTVYRVFYRGGLVLSIYGIVQFVSPMPWDVLWVLNAKVASIGIPAPYLIRPFSTLNSPAPYAYFLAVSLVLCTDPRRTVKPIFIIIVVVALLVTSVRSAWIGLIIGLLLAALTGKVKRLFLFVGFFMTIVTLVTVLIQFDLLGPTISKRFETFSNLEQDTSVKARIRMYEEFSASILDNGIGKGYGNSALANRLSDYNRNRGGDSGDSGIISAIEAHGLLGVLFIIVAFLQMTSLKKWGLSGYQDRGYSVCFVFLTVLIPAGNIFLGFQGVLYWLVLFMALSYSNANMANSPKLEESSRL